MTLAERADGRLGVLGAAELAGAGDLLGARRVLAAVPPAFLEVESLVAEATRSPDFAAALAGLLDAFWDLRAALGPAAQA